MLQFVLQLVFRYLSNSCNWLILSGCPLPSCNVFQTFPCDIRVYVSTCQNLTSAWSHPCETFPFSFVSPNQLKDHIRVRQSCLRASAQMLTVETSVCDRPVLARQTVQTTQTENTFCLKSAKPLHWKPSFVSRFLTATATQKSKHWLSPEYQGNIMFAAA